MPTNNAFSFDPSDPLAKSPGETARANAALRAYYLMGPGRSLRGLTARYREQSANEGGTEKPPTTRFATLATWSTDFLWQERIATQDGIDADLAKNEWDDRRRTIRENDWDQGSQLRDLANRILATSPEFIKRREKRVKGSPKVVDITGKVLDPGSPDRVIITLALDSHLAVKAIQAGSSLTRLAAGLETDRTAQDVNVTGGLTLKTEVDLADFDPENARAYLLDLSNLLASLAGASGEGKSQPSSGNGADGAEANDQ